MVTFIAAIFLIFQGFARVIKYIFTHKILLIILAILIVVLIVIPKLQCNSSPTNTQSKPLLEYQKSAPPITDAPYILETTSRIYYVIRYKDDGLIISLEPYAYYVFSNNQWLLSPAPLLINRDVYGPVRLSTR